MIMRILIVMGGYFPGKKYGGPPVSIDNFCSLMKNYECFIVTHDHDLFETERYQGIDVGWNDRGNCKVKYLSDAEYNKDSFEKIMRELKPDYLYLQGLFQSCVFPCLKVAKKLDIQVLLAPRGELCAGALCLKKYKKIPYIMVVRLLGLVRSIHWQSTSDEETAAIKKWMKVDDSHIHFLTNIPSVPTREYHRNEKKPGEGHFVFVSRIHPKKNLLSAIKYFEEIDGAVYFDIFGPIEDESYWKECEKAISRLPKNVQVEYKGLVTHDKVHEIFSGYDAFLFPTLSENFGHVIAESLIVGTPVIISDQTPWTDINDLGYGKAIPLNNRIDFVNEIKKVIQLNQDEMNTASSVVKKYLAKKWDTYNLQRDYETVFQLRK